MLLPLSFLLRETSCNELSRLLDSPYVTNNLFLDFSDVVTRNTFILSHCKMFLNNCSAMYRPVL